MTESKKNMTEVNVMLASLAEDIVNLMLREHQSIHLELEHVGKLISDASQSLTASFDELNKIAAKQHAIISSTPMNEMIFSSAPSRMAFRSREFPTARAIS